jgi:hypothetical protein
MYKPPACIAISIPVQIQREYLDPLRKETASTSWEELDKPGCKLFLPIKSFLKEFAPLNPVELGG